MSAVNFCYQSIPLLLLLAIYLAVLVSEHEPVKRGTYAFNIAFLPACLVLLVVHLRTLKTAFIDRPLPLSTALPKATYLKGIESYWRQSGNRFLAKREYDKAAICYKQALQLSSDPMLLTNAAHCYRKLAMYPAAERLYTTAALIYPTRVRYKFDLMNFYAHIGSIERSKSIAREVITLCAAERSARSRRYQHAALKILNL
jgi:tetratricopeptide (TPR) repeat protein